MSVPRCRDISRRVSESLDGGLKLTALERLHLLYCIACRRLRRQLQLIARAVALAPESGPALSDEAKRRMKRSLGG